MIFRQNLAPRAPSEAHFRGHEHRYTDYEGPKGNVEFVIFEGKQDSLLSVISTVIEVKDDVSMLGSAVGESHCQLFAEIIASYKYNLAIDSGYNGSIHGALTDGFDWIFARVHRSVVNETEDTYHIVYSHLPISLIQRRGAFSNFGNASTVDSLKCLQYLVYICYTPT